MKKGSGKMIEQQLPNGQLIINDNVISLIAAYSINDVEGIANTVADLKENLISVVTNRGEQKGINVKSVENEVVLQVKIAVHFGVKIHEVCKNLQKHIKEQVEMMTGVTVNEVNVMVIQVKFPQEEAK